MQRLALLTGAWALAVGISCGGAKRDPAEPSTQSAAKPSSHRPASDAKREAHAASATSELPGERHKGRRMSLADARRHMLNLVNGDRATQGLPPVTLDESSAQAAGQRHAEDMARHGFLGHWGSDGSVPEQRYSEAGGTDFVMENASCITDEQEHDLEKDPRVDIEALERAESMFFNETPPNDGHRKNILQPHHRKVGIGIALTKETAQMLSGLCLTQEFIDDYGTYAALPKKIGSGGTVRVSGTINAPAKFGGVGISRVDLPKPIPVGDLNKRRSYSIPEPYEVFWPRGFKTSIPVQVTGSSFTIDVPIAKGPGLYGIAIMGQYPGMKNFGMISLRTIEVR